MPIASTEEFETILMNLSVLRYIFKSKSKSGQYDLNKAAENFFRDFLNLVFDYELINLNDVSSNYAAIDLGDVKEKICIQVTADNGSTKIKDSLTKFNKHGLEKQYSRFIMLILTEKRNYTTKFPVSGIHFDAKTDIWDVDDLLKEIEKLSLEKKAALAELLRKEMRPLFAQFAENGSIFKVQPVANRPASSAQRVLDYMGYDLNSGDGKKVFKRIKDLYIVLANLSPQARKCLHTVITRGQIKHNGFQLPTQEYDNLLSSLAEWERIGNFRSLEAAGLFDSDDGFIIAGWRLESGVDFFIVVSDIFEHEAKIDGALETLVIDADFTLLD